LFSKNEKGNIVYEDEQLGEKVLLRSDGTSIYITQDIALGKIRYEDRKMNHMVYVVGNEQESHFKFLFAIFKALGYPFADKCFHMSYGMISLPDGKMKSREGNVVDADDLADSMHAQSYETLKERHTDLSENALHTRAEQIAMAAIKFFILKYDAKKDFVFDREESLRFDGESGPYIQYTVARCNSILEKT
jgi:arginyl-tRNA synthetase